MPALFAKNTSGPHLLRLNMFSSRHSYLKVMVVLFLLTGSLFFYEQSLAKQPEPGQIIEKNLTETIKRLERIENQFVIIRDYNDDFLAVIYGSLAAVVAVAVLLIGFNWFQNRNLQKREFDALKNEMISMIHSQLSESSSKIDEKLSNLDNVIRKKVEIVSKSAIRDIRQVLLIPKYIELEKEIEKQIESKQIYPHDIDKLARCAVEIGGCFPLENDIVTEDNAGDYYKKLLKLIENVLNSPQNNFSLELLAATENSINMVPDESYVGDNAHLYMKETLKNCLQNIRNNNKLPR